MRAPGSRLQLTLPLTSDSRRVYARRRLYSVARPMGSGLGASVWGTGLVDPQPSVVLGHSRLIPNITRSDANLGVTVTALALPTFATAADADADADDPTVAR